MKRFQVIPKQRIGVVFCCLLFAGCSNSPEDTRPQTHTVEIRAMQFQPAELSVKKGDTIVFTNKDILVHDVTENNKTWSSSPLATGQSFRKVVMESAGYHCSFHPVMTGTIVVP